MLIIAFEVFPDAIEPELSKTNQDKRPTITVLRTGSGAFSYTQADKHQTITPQPNRNHLCFKPKITSKNKNKDWEKPS
jgi:hypothetical protein